MMREQSKTLMLIDMTEVCAESRLGESSKPERSTALRIREKVAGVSEFEPYVVLLVFIRN